MKHLAQHLDRHLNRLLDGAAEMNDEILLDYFRFQYEHCMVYRQYADLLDLRVERAADIPFLPIAFFKTREVYAASTPPQAIFTSSGTAGTVPSRHLVADLGIYERSYRSCFRRFFGSPPQRVIAALLPSYLERGGSSLVEMARGLAETSGSPRSGFFLNEHRKLRDLLLSLRDTQTPTILLGVGFALLDFAEKYTIDFPDLIVMETGGMKGRREEPTRKELHALIRAGFGTRAVASEYGMTELLSQAYSTDGGLYRTPPWMKIAVRDPRDPFLRAPNGSTGGINVIDLANIYSCSFVETQDLGVARDDGSFEVLGRFDESETRGCSLMI
ncbi:MAG: acyltransferase [Prevotellaceae bacterium]|jgi:hypothetical protein|nr:acyltransferase [Prevotellaceae bacterium]